MNNKLTWFGIICTVSSLLSVIMVGLAKPAMGAAVPYIPYIGPNGQDVCPNNTSLGVTYLAGPHACCPVEDHYSGGLCVGPLSGYGTNLTNITPVGPPKPSTGQGEEMPHIKVEFNRYLVYTNQYSNMTFYLNTTDNHLHLKGLLTNLLHETVYGPQTDLFGPLMAFLNATGHKSKLGLGLPGLGQLSFTLSFEDNATGAQLKSVTGLVQGPIGPGKTVPFDVDTGYGKAQASQEFPYMKLSICC